jgi:uncharacterized protein (DUF2235 family)
MNPLKVRRLTDITENEITAHRFILEGLNDQDNHRKMCMECPKPVWFTAFFDGTGNNFDDDGKGISDADNPKAQYSNIAKLGKFAHPKDSDRFHTHYAAGVGTPYPGDGVDDDGGGIDKALGMAAASKGMARIQAMLNKLEAAVNKYGVTVSQINLAVFGFSRGATQARAFVRLLNGKLATQEGDKLIWNRANMNGKKPEVVLYFMGIMDTVSSTGYGGSSGEAIAKYALPVAGSLLGPVGRVVRCLAL